LSVTNHQIEAAKITNYCQYINNKHNKFIAKDKKVTYRKIVALKNTKLSQAGSSHIEKQVSFFSNTEYPHTEERRSKSCFFIKKKFAKLLQVSKKQLPLQPQSREITNKKIMVR